MPLGVEALVVTVRVEEPLVVTEGGLRAAVAPEGNPLTAKPTAPVKPLTGVTTIVEVPLVPASTDCAAFVPERPKIFHLGRGITGREHTKPSRRF